MNKEDFKIWLGEDRDEKIFWNPQTERSPHIALIGGSGSGKTQTIKSICFELKEKNIPSIIIDFHDDFRKLADNLVTLDNTTINPLEVQIGEKPLDVAYKIAKIFANIFSFGEIQEATIREAIKNYYLKSGILDLKIENDGKFKLLPFSAFKDILERMDADKIKNILAKLSIVFDTDLFMNSTNTAIPFNTLLKKVSVIKLNDFPTDEIKSMIAEIFIRNLINYFYLHGKSENNEVKLFLVIDEAHRLTYDGSPVDLLLRESRKYGAGCIIASQGPQDFSDNVLRNVGAIISFQASLPKDMRYLAECIGTDKDHIAKLSKPGQCYIKLASEKQPIYVQITQAEERPRYKELMAKYNEVEAKERSEKEKEKLREEQRIKEEYSRLSKEFPELEKKVKEITESLKDQQLKNKQIANEVMSKEEELQNNRQEIDSFQERVLKLNTRIEGLEQENKILENIRKELKEKTAEVNSLLDRTLVLGKQLSELKEEKNNLLEKVEKLSSELKDIKKVALKADLLTDETEKLNKQIDALKARVSEEKDIQKAIENRYSAKLREIEYTIGNSISGKLIKNKLDFSINKNHGNFCKACGKPNKNEVKFCEFCGERL